MDVSQRHAMQVWSYLKKHPSLRPPESADRREKRDDKMVYFIDALPAGISKFRHLARAMHTGKFVAPPTRAEFMYEPSIFGSTPATHVRVTGAAKP